jgi:hypothetical protein
LFFCGADYHPFNGDREVFSPIVDNFLPVENDVWRYNP